MRAFVRSFVLACVWGGAGVGVGVGCVCAGSTNCI